MSTEQKWTPGQWRVINNGPHWNNQRITNWEIAYSQDGELVAEHVYEESDAYLMAAAKELYILLETAACPSCDGSGAFYQKDGDVTQCKWCYERDAALAKARG